MQNRKYRGGFESFVYYLSSLDCTSCRQTASWRFSRLIASLLGVFECVKKKKKKKKEKLFHESSWCLSDENANFKHERKRSKPSVHVQKWTISMELHNSIWYRFIAKSLRKSISLLFKKVSSRAVEFLWGKKYFSTMKGIFSPSVERNSHAWRYA